MTRLEYFESGWAKVGLDLGFITPTVFEHYSRFKVYQVAKEQDNGHIQSVDIAAKLTRSSRTSVRRSIKFFLS